MSKISAGDLETFPIPPYEPASSLRRFSKEILFYGNLVEQDRHSRAAANYAEIRIKEALPGASEVDTKMRKDRIPFHLLRVVAGHQGWIHDIDIDITSSFFVTGSADNTVMFWETYPKQKRLVTFTGHNAAVRCVALHPRRPYLFSGSHDKTVICWDLEKNSPIKTFAEHSKGVHCLALHPTLDLLFTGSPDKNIKVWDIRSGTSIFTLVGHSAGIGCLQGQSNIPQVISGGLDGSIRLWDLKMPRPNILTHFRQAVRSLELSPVDYTFAAAGGHLMKQFKLPEGTFIDDVGNHGSLVNQITYLPGGELVSASIDGTLKFWDEGVAQEIAPVGDKSTDKSILCIKGLRLPNGQDMLLAGAVDKTFKVYVRD